MLHLRITRRLLPSLQIVEENDGDMDQVQGVRTQNGPVSSKSVFIKLCRGSMLQKC